MGSEGFPLSGCRGGWGLRDAFNMRTQKTGQFEDKDNSGTNENKVLYISLVPHATTESFLGKKKTHRTLHSPCKETQ